MENLLNHIRALVEYRLVLNAIKTGQSLKGLALQRSARLPILAALHEDLNLPFVLLTDRADHALRLHDELAYWLPGSVRRIFSEPTPLFYEEAAWGNVTRRERLQTLTTLAIYHLPYVSKPEKTPIIITSARALMTRTLPRRDFLKAIRLLKTGQSISPAVLLAEWVKYGYEPVDTVLEPGQFSHRGGILDVWTPAEENPARIDFFGDEIETIRRFNPASQMTVDSRDSILIPPGREFLLSQADLVDRQLSEFHIPVLHPMPSCLLDYLPDKALVFVDDWGILEGNIAEIEEQAVKLRVEYIEDGVLAKNYPIPYLTWSELRDHLETHQHLELGRSTTDEDNEINKLAGMFQPIERFGGRLKPFLTYLEKAIRESKLVFVVSRQSTRVEELWEEDYPGRTNENPVFIEGSLSEGWEAAGHLLVTDAEIFGWERPQPRQRPRPWAETPEAAYADLKPGDWVVHVDYGVGKFAGLVQRSLEGLEREYLCIEYKNNDQVYVPIHQADRLTRYIGPNGSPPVAGNLGTQEWTETRKRVREAVQEVARELLDLYAERQVADGFAFSPDTAWQGELESSFPYVETEDQTKALVEIKNDMQTARPMDRLLCGDVGYGKTELGLRAAFKAVMDGRQVAVLVPTTVLAQQHFDTFKHRLSAFPVTVEMLSRFRTTREQNTILYGLAQGAIDIIIGTHRLISADVQFKDLGLVIIDEEQRFGVTHKEHLKKLRTEVDVLTLTATPIPRTLYMALTGVRDISNLNTPPEERLPIVTHIGPYSPKLTRQAILREMERGGQVFFVHNRVQTIDSMRMHLEKLVPEARVAIGHGQMPEQELANVMRRFTSGEVDILLSTSIIESGLDIPNANTLIVDRADAFGLAQLYQLRGRVGRGAVRAYAYFFRHNKLRPTPEGQERLEVIAENTQLGAGYSIAMRDLEMRGAGEILGTRQSGHIAAVGFHLYTRLLATAVRKQRKKYDLPDLPTKSFLQDTGLPVNVDLPLSIGIPADYIKDPNLRLRLYRRLADLTDEAALDALAAEFTDRFGSIPEMVTNLFYQVKIKLIAERAGLISVSNENGQIVLRYPPSKYSQSTKRLPDLGREVRGGKNAYWCSFGRDADWKTKLIGTLDTLGKTPSS